MKKADLRLPPQIKDIRHGRFKLELGQLYSMRYGGVDYSNREVNSQLQFKIAFPGEEEPTILRVLNTDKVLLFPNQATYEITVPAPQIIKYLDSIGEVEIQVYEITMKKNIGRVAIPLSKFLNRRISEEDKYKHAFLFSETTLPILSLESNSPVGEIQIKLEGEATVERPDSGKEIVDLDKRIANSMAKQKENKKFDSGKYTLQKIPEEIRQPRTFKDLGKLKKKFTQKEEELRAVEDQESHEYNKDLEEVMSKAESLRQKMAKSIVPSFRQSPFKSFTSKTEIPAQDFDLEVNELEDSLEDIEKVLEKEIEIPTAKSLPQTSERQEDRSSLSIHDISRMKVNIIGLSITSESIYRKLNGHKVFALVKFPTTQSRSPAISEEEMKIQISINDRSQKLIEIGRVQECGIKITDDNFASFVSSKLIVELIVEIDGGVKLFGRGELSMQKVVLSSNHLIDTLITISHVAPHQDGVASHKKEERKIGKTAKKIGKKVGKVYQIPKDQLEPITPPEQHVADLRIKLQLISDIARPMSNMESIKTTATQPKSIGLILMVKIDRARDILLRKYENDHTQIFRNLFVNYQIRKE